MNTESIKDILEKFIVGNKIECPYKRDWCDKECVGCIVAELSYDN